MKFWNHLFNYDGPILGAPLRYLILATVALLASLIVSVFFVQWVTRIPPPASTVEPSRIQEARALRHYANQITAFTDDFLDRVPPEKSMPRPAVQQWITSSFRTSVYTLQQAMNREPFASPEFTQLRDAARDLMVMANNGSDAALRRRVLRDAAEAVTAAEEFISQRQLNALLMEPRRIPAAER